MGFLSGLGSALVGGAASLLGGSSANKSSAKEAAKSRQFTERQLKHRHQWEVSDLKKAGLNPILSAGGTPSIGSSAMAQQKNIASDAVAAANTALTAKKQKEEINLLKAQTLKTAAETSRIGADTVPKDLQAELLEQSTDIARSAGYAGRSTAKAIKAKMRSPKSPGGRIIQFINKWRKK